MRIGVLALQGGFRDHIGVLDALGHEVVEVRDVRGLEGVDGLVLPGGESTAQLRLLDAALRSALDRRVKSGAPVLTTCAGTIVAVALGWLDAVVERNAHGPQLHSAEGRAEDGTPVVLIRAPRFVSLGPEVEVMTRLRGEPVLVREGAVVAATFHPELTGDAGVHRLAFAPLSRLATRPSAHRTRRSR